METSSQRFDDPGAPLTPLTRAALALHRRPGSYVALLGAGISKSTGIASAWEILIDLARTAAVAAGDDPADVTEWWPTNFGRSLSYSDVLEVLASTPIERRALLEPYFRRGDSYDATGVRLPSIAHREIARLVARGSLRVIVTLNFDHLMEEALRAEGIEPTVIVGARGIAEMEPLHAQRAAVVHLHGEYLSPDLLNTPGELERYSDPVEQLIRQVSEEYGLLVVGWSAEWDKRLVELLTPASAIRHATWWIEPAEFNAAQCELARARRADEIHLTADDAMTRLAAALDGVELEQQRVRPLDVAAGVAAMKRELRQNGSFRLAAHDTVREAIGRLNDARGELIQSIPRVDLTDGSHESRSESVLAAVRPAATYAAVLAYWGDQMTDRWWLQDLEELAHRPHVSGQTALIGLARSYPMVMSYAAGAAAVAAARWDLVFRLISEPTAENDHGSSRHRLLEVLHPGSCGVFGGAGRLFRFTVTILHQHLGLGVATATASWERFEYLCALATITGDWLPWVPCMRAEGVGASENMASPAVWLDGHLDVVQPYITGAIWADGADMSLRRSQFNTAFAIHVSKLDLGLLPSGGGMLPSSRRYPGRFDDAPPPLD